MCGKHENVPCANAAAKPPESSTPRFFEAINRSNISGSRGDARVSAGATLAGGGGGGGGGGGAPVEVLKRVPSSSSVPEYREYSVFWSCVGHVNNSALYYSAGDNKMVGIKPVDIKSGIIKLV